MRTKVKAISKRAKLDPGYLFAIRGADDLFYAGQLTSQNMVGFFRWRGELTDIESALDKEVMFRCGVYSDTIGRALRVGTWFLIGQRELHPTLCDDPVLVQWPAFSSQAWLWKGSEVVGGTTIDDGSIQELEVIGGWDAHLHIPHRLPAEFNDDTAAWQWRGRVRDQRLQRAMQGLAGEIQAGDQNAL